MREEDGCGCGHRHGEGTPPSKKSIALKLAVAVAIGAILFLTACAKRPTGATTPIGEFEVSKLFDVDSCSVYRFYDDGRYRYFTKCVGAVSSNTESLAGGKHKYPDTNVTGYVTPPPTTETTEYALESSRITSQ